MKNTITPEVKKLIETNQLALATIMPDGRPNVISVANAQVVGDLQLLLTDNYMNQTLTDILNDPHVVALVWNKDNKGAKLIGTAEYFDRGQWWERVKQWPSNKNFPVKGAVLITITNIIISA